MSLEVAITRVPVEASSWPMGATRRELVPPALEGTRGARRQGDVDRIRPAMPGPHPLKGA